MKELPDEVKGHFARSIAEDALGRDRGIHEGLAFSFDWNGKQWSVVVDLQERWLKIMSKDELEAAIKEGTSKN